MAKNTVLDTVGDDSRPGVANVSSANKGHRAVRTATAGFSAPASQKVVTQTLSEPSLVKCQGEQVPVRHARKTFYIDAPRVR